MIKLTYDEAEKLQKFHLNLIEEATDALDDAFCGKVEDQFEIIQDIKKNILRIEELQQYKNEIKE